MVTKFKTLLATAMIAFSFSAQAGIILTQGTAVTDPSHTENFESGTAGNNITDQFSANGLTFKTLGDAGIALVGSNVCPNTNGVSGKYLAMGMRYPCTQNTALNAVSMMFDGDVEALSWTGFSRTIGNGFKVEFWKDGQMLDSNSTFYDSFNKFENKTVLVSGGVFDEIRFIEASGFQGFFTIDNMAWKMAPVVVEPPVSDVPEPSIALLFGAGMIGMGFMRKKKAV
jgi:hypothetical protein